MCVMRQPPTTYDRVPNFTRIESINFDSFNMRSVSGCVASYAVSSSQLTHRFLLERPVKNCQGGMVTTPKDLGAPYRRLFENTPARRSLFCIVLNSPPDWIRSIGSLAPPDIVTIQNQLCGLANSIEVRRIHLLPWCSRLLKPAWNAWNITLYIIILKRHVTLSRLVRQALGAKLFLKLRSG